MVRIVALLMLLVEEMTKILMQNKEVIARAKASLLLRTTMIVGEATRSLIAGGLRKKLNVGRMLMARRIQRGQF